MELDKIVPHQIEAEQSILGGMLNDPSGIPVVMELLKGNEFYKDSHRQIYQAIKDLHAKNEPADLVTVTDELIRRRQLEGIGGASYLANLADCVMTSENAPAYAAIIKKKADCRRLIQSANEMASLAYDGRSPDEVIEIAKRTIQKIESGRISFPRDMDLSIKQGMKEALERIERRIDLKGKIPGIETGFEKLDRLTCGMNSQDLWVLAGRPSQGKTAFALNVTRHAAGKGVHVLWFSLDMSRAALWDRLICTESRINLAKIRSGNLHRLDHASVIQGACTLQDLPITILDNPCSDADIIQATKKIEPGLVVVDFLTKVIPTSNLGNVNNNYGAISKAVKNLAKEMDIPILLLCQLTRLNERENRPPRESDLRDSGEIEQDADTILFLHSQDKTKPERDLIIAKQRQGELAILKFGFYGEVQRFEPMLR